MAIHGQPVRYKVSDALARKAGSKEDRKTGQMEIDAKRQRFFKVNDLAGSVPVAQAALDAVMGEAAKIEKEIAKLRAAAAASGKPNPVITQKVAELAELPAMVEAAQARLDAARQTYTAAKEAMDADERADAAEIAVEAEMRRTALERANKIEAARAKAREART